jgi:hypothetical protein
MKSMAAGTLVVCLLGGCATPAYQPVPLGYNGPIATLSDGGTSEGRTSARIFAATEVDGNPIENSIEATNRASYGHGLSQTVKWIRREVLPRPMIVKLVGKTVAVAPIVGIFAAMAGASFSVEGTVSFDPRPGGFYAVNGELSKDGSSVWIEDALTNQPVTERVFAK